MPFFDSRRGTSGLRKPLCFAADRGIGRTPIPHVSLPRGPLFHGRLMRRCLALALLLTLPTGSDAAAQVVDDALVPGGRVRLQMFPVYTSWGSRFGRTADGTTGREDLGEDLTSASAETLFPGAASLASAIASMTGTGGYSPVLGETVAHVAKDITRIEFGAHIGIFDWLTVGAVLPWTRTRTNVDVYLRPDTVAGDLGINPVVTDTGVDAFLADLAAAEAAAQANASQICAGSPGSASCTAALDLADRAASFSASASTAYSASPFFPLAGSGTATSLQSAVAALDSDLTAAGLAGISAPMVFASQGVSEEDFRLLSTLPGLGVAGDTLGSIRSPWYAGDVEVSATVRLLESAPRDPMRTAPTLSYRLLGTVLVRLPTGRVDDPDVFLDVGTGDGQTDFEGRLQGDLMLGGRLALRLGGRYGIQHPRTLIRRVAPPEQVLAPLSSRQLVEWDPGAYFGVEVAPSFHFSPELSMGAEYWAFRKYRDTYTLTGASVGAPVDPTVMQPESGVTVHSVGGVLRYDTVARRMATGSTTPLQLHLRVQHAVAGGGGQTPVTTRIEFGVRLFRRFWGTP